MRRTRASIYAKVRRCFHMVLLTSIQKFIIIYGYMHQLMCSLCLDKLLLTKVGRYAQNFVFDIELTFFFLTALMFGTVAVISLQYSSVLKDDFNIVC